MSNDYDIATPSTSMKNNCTSVALNFFGIKYQGISISILLDHNFAKNVQI